MKSLFHNYSFYRHIKCNIFQYLFLKFSKFIIKYFIIKLFRLVEVCLAKGDFPKGLQFISTFEEYPDVTPLHLIRVILLSSQITCASSLPNERTAVITDCIVHLCSALELATRNHLSYYKALVKMHLANVQVNFILEKHFILEICQLETIYNI